MIVSILQDIEKVLSKTELQILERGQIEYEMYSVCIGTYSKISAENGLYDQLFYKIKSLNQEFLPLFQDISLQISREHILEVLKTNIDSQIPIKYEEYETTITRIDNFRCEFKSNAIRVEAKWRIAETDIFESKEVFIRMFLKQYPNGRAIQTRAVRLLKFLDLDLTEIDPFKVLPINSRLEFSKEANRVFQESVKNISLIVPETELNDHDLSFFPSEFLYEDAIYIYSRSIKRSKLRYPLAMRLPFQGYRFVMSIRKEHIIPILSQIVSSKDANLITANFYYGRIVIKSYGSKKKSILHISVNGKVWMEHSIRIVAFPGRLDFQSTWLSWEYKIKAELCWPICGRVMDEATNEIMNVIESKKYFSGSIPSSMQSRSQCKINPESLLFYFD